MSKEKRRVPKLRFPGFTEDWEQRKLGDFTNQINTFVNPEDAKLPLWSLTAEAGLIEKSDRYERDFLVKKKDQFKRIGTNTLVYNPMNITIGSIDIYTGLYPIAVSGYYVSIVYDKNIDTDFLKEALLLPSSLKMYKNYATGSLIERQRVQYPTFSKLQLLFPNLDEQKAIGQLFKSLNLNITLHQCKLEHLNLKKKALLQKLFPKNGECYPELRFPGFTDAWEQRKLEDICSYQSSSLTINDIDESGQYDLYDANSLIGKTNKGYMKMEYITIIKDGAGVGRTRMLPKNSMFLGTMGALTPKNKCLGFLYQLVTNANLGKICTGSTIPHIYFKDYGKLKFCIPSIIEQEVIGKFFNNIDYLITLHQRKLEHLQLQKKALLQQMFV